MRLTIRAYRRRNSSANGNPAYTFAFEGGTRADTMSDAGFCYAVGNHDMRHGCAVDVEFTKAGRIRHMEPAS